MTKQEVRTSLRLSLADWKPWEVETLVGEVWRIARLAARHERARLIREGYRVCEHAGTEGECQR